MKKKLAMLLSVAMIAVVIIGGTMAYLTDTDSDVNVMTVGNVEIDQIEQEWNENKTELVDFTQAKPLLPYVGEFGWEYEIDEEAYRRFTMENVVDKYVSVKNTGKSDAYVRTFIALEMGDYAYEDFNMVGVSINKLNGDEFGFAGAWEWTDDFVAEIDGKNYNIMVAVHNAAVKPEETTIPSLLQVYLSKDATNETVEKLDGNGNGTYDILVFSEAVQTEGFADAKTALNTAFGNTSAPTYYHPWKDGVDIPVVVNNLAELEKAMEAGGEVVLNADIEVTPESTLKRGNYIAAIFEDTTLDLNGHDITFDLGPDKANTNPRMFYVYYADLTIKGEGTLAVTNDAAVAWVASGGGNLYIEGDNYISDNHVTGNPNEIFAIIYSSGGEVHVYGGTFTYDNMPGGTNGGFNVQDWWGHKITLYEGVLLSNEVYRQPQDTSAYRIRLAEGCTLKEVVIDGTTWYEVVAE